MKPTHQFTLPKTPTCVVVWERNGKKTREYIDTPKSNEQLQRVMLGKKVGFSEIKYIEAVDTQKLTFSMVGNFARR